MRLSDRGADLEPVLHSLPDSNCQHKCFTRAPCMQLKLSVFKCFALTSHQWPLQYWQLVFSLYSIGTNFVLYSAIISTQL